MRLLGTLRNNLSKINGYKVQIKQRGRHMSKQRSGMAGAQAPSGGGSDQKKTALSEGIHGDGSFHDDASLPPPPHPADSPVWMEQMYTSPLDAPRRIFCNRSLNMKSIKAVGFDMDYTLASYKPETFEKLAHDETVNKLVKHFGYPTSLYDLTFDWRYMTRGLVIDKERGNVLKVDRHKYVKLAYHGFKELTREERMSQYNNSGKQFDFDEPNFALIDTLFSLAEAHLFMQLVEMKDNEVDGFPQQKSYADLYREVRGAVDLCHRDGSIKREVAKSPEKYLYSDPGIVTVLDMMRKSGKKVFLATNSLWDYTSVVMNWLIDGKSGQERDDEWLSYFDAVMVGCGKPRFFIERKDLFEVHPSTGMLWNTEGGSPMVPIGEADLPSPLLGSTAPSHVDHEHAVDGRARVFQGGCFIDLHKMLGVKAGAEVLYVGDHIYGDVLRSKRDLGWRTMLVIPELETELRMLLHQQDAMKELKLLRQQRDAVEDQLQRLQWRLENVADLGDGQKDDDKVALEEVVRNLSDQRKSIRERHKRLLKEYHEGFHPVWGQLFKTGYKNSRYAHQAERFACMYTSHVSNLMFYSPLKSYNARMDSMAHEESF